MYSHHLHPTQGGEPDMETEEEQAQDNANENGGESVSSNRAPSSTSQSYPRPSGAPPLPQYKAPRGRGGRGAPGSRPILIADSNRQPDWKRHQPHSQPPSLLTGFSSYSRPHPQVELISRRGLPLEAPQTLQDYQYQQQLVAQQEQLRQAAAASYYDGMYAGSKGQGGREWDLNGLERTNDYYGNGGGYRGRKPNHSKTTPSKQTERKKKTGGSGNATANAAAGSSKKSK